MLYFSLLNQDDPPNKAAPPFFPPVKCRVWGNRWRVQLNGDTCSTYILVILV